jgi:transposase
LYDIIIDSLFASSHDAAINAAIASYVNPREWLTDVLTRIPKYNSDYSLDLAELLPHNWKALQKPEETVLKIQ